MSRLNTQSIESTCHSGFRKVTTPLVSPCRSTATASDRRPQGCHSFPIQSAPIPETFKLNLQSVLETRSQSEVVVTRSTLRPAILMFLPSESCHDLQSLSSLHRDSWPCQRREHTDPETSDRAETMGYPLLFTSKEASYFGCGWIAIA